MSQQLFNDFSIDVQQKFYEKQTQSGHIAVYQTAPFGMTMTLNGQIILCDDSFFHHEMMTHPALFSHPKPEKVAIIGNRIGILQEVLKHPSVQEVTCITQPSILEDVVSEYFGDSYKVNDTRVYHETNTLQKWLAQAKNESFDVIILNENSDDFLTEYYQGYHRTLHTDGILVQACQANSLTSKTFKPLYQNIQHAGFSDWQFMHFSQPSFPKNLRTIMLATKRPTFKRVREIDVYNRPFKTRYYNFDVHKAALALPEFMRAELEVL